MSKAKTKVITQKHHVVYESDKNKEILYTIRKGVHQVVTLMKRFKELTPEEIHVICLEAQLKRRF